MNVMSPALLLATLLLAGCSQPSGYDAAAEATTTAPKDEMPMAATEPAPAPVAKTATATGTVEAVDAAAGKITLAHDPVEALGWPAMTMGFKATPEQIASVKVGQKVEFIFTSQGMEATITRIEAAN
jgi:Cu(I)/Ag(I) efflux system protein CusF